MGLIQEFKEFAVKGSVVDLAVGVVIGAAFGKIVTSMVNDIIMPLIGVVTGGTNFNDRFLALSSTHYATIEEAQKAGAAVLKYGSFVQTVLDFVIVAFCIFMVIKQVNRFTKKPEPAKT
jgi:large conductance mechanosensitive channel